MGSETIIFFKDTFRQTPTRIYEFFNTFWTWIFIEQHVCESTVMIVDYRDGLCLWKGQGGRNIEYMCYLRWISVWQRGSIFAQKDLANKHSSRVCGWAWLFTLSCWFPAIWGIQEFFAGKVWCLPDGGRAGRRCVAEFWRRCVDAKGQEKVVGVGQPI